MSNLREYPIEFIPKGLSDAWDSTLAFRGACHSLQNLIFDQSNPEQVLPRPGVGAPLTSFATFTSPTYVSVQTVVGSVTYGMVASGATAGYDEPFAYNDDTNAFIAITGVTSGNVPATQATTGDWTPPTMTIVGTKIIITHPGFSGTGSNFFGVIDISNPAAPTWTAANTATNALPSVPRAVSNFNNRAYFACANVAYYSDVLDPVTMTNAGQSLTVGDTTDITGFSGLPIQTSSAGIVAALVIFKGFQIWQVLGDAAISGSLSQNFLSLSFGCNSPRTIVQTPWGIIFLAVDGAYYVSPYGQVLPLSHNPEVPLQDISSSFHNILNPGRACAAFAGSIYRVCLETLINSVESTVDYWFDFNFRRWNGPHSFVYDCASSDGNYFILTYRTAGAKIYKSKYLNEKTSVYNDDGTDIVTICESALFPKTPNINVKQVIQSTLEVGSKASVANYQITALDENFNTIGDVTITVHSSSSLWGDGGTWGGGGVWSSTDVPPLTETVPWEAPLVFKKIAIRIIASAVLYLSIGAFFCKYRDCGYLNVR